MAIVTLLSDWGLSDYYVAAVKGRLYSECPDLHIVDITHDLPLYDTAAAAFVLKQTYPHFPKGTIHCIGLNDIAEPNQSYLIVYEAEQYFIGTGDNLFSELFDHQPQGAWRIAIQPDGQSATFPSLNLFPMVAAHLAKGGHPEEIGEPHDWGTLNFSLIRDMAVIQPLYDRSNRQIGMRLDGKVIYTDHYGNCVTNIRQEQFERLQAEYPRFQINIQGYNAKTPLNRINRVYSEAPAATLCALFPDHRFLEIAMNKALASQYLAKRRTIIYIDFLRPVNAL